MAMILTNCERSRADRRGAVRHSGHLQRVDLPRAPIPQIEINLNREKAARYGVNTADIQNVIQTGVGQAPVSTVYVGERTYPLTVRYTTDARNSPQALGDLLVHTASGAQLPLSLLADIGVRSGESTVTRENGQRNLTIRIDNRDRDLTSYLAEAQAKIENRVHFDKSKIRLEWGGQFENQRRAEARLLVILALVMGMMLIFLTIGIKAFRQALLILGVVPLAMLGGLISLHLTGQNLNVASGVGFIALFGVAVQNGIIMVSNLNRMRKSVWSRTMRSCSGATERLRPVLMTATVATSMLPAAIHTGVGSDVQRGIATVVVGGLAISTILTLVVLPSMYHVIEHWAEQRHGQPRWADEIKVPACRCSGAGRRLDGLRRGARDFKRPEAPAAADYGVASSQEQTASRKVRRRRRRAYSADAGVPSDWWTRSSRRSSTLVERALKANPNVHAAQAVRQAHELYVVQRSSFFPAVAGNFGAARSQFPPTR